LLFDRLVRPEHAGRARDAKAQQVRHTYDGEGLEQSVLEQLRWLLNTRVAIDYQTLDTRNREGQRSTVDYGIPDLSAYSVGEQAAMQRLSEHLTRTIAIFEPRISDPKVTVGPADDRNQRLTVEVSGVAAAGMIVIPVRYKIELGGAEEGPDAV